MTIFIFDAPCLHNKWGLIKMFTSVGRRVYQTVMAQVYSFEHHHVGFTSKKDNRNKDTRGNGYGV